VREALAVATANAGAVSTIALTQLAMLTADGAAKSHSASPVHRQNEFALAVVVGETLAPPDISRMASGLTSMRSVSSYSDRMRASRE
jgi:hypothetical protein